MISVYCTVGLVPQVHLVLRALTSTMITALGTEARLRMLLALNFFRQASSPINEVRGIASHMETSRLEQGATLCQVGDSAGGVSILLHGEATALGCRCPLAPPIAPELGKVDLYNASGELAVTMDAGSYRSELSLVGSFPNVRSRLQPRQSHSAVCASSCLLLTGMGAAVDALAPLLEPPKAALP